MKFDRCPGKAIGHLFYAISSFGHPSFHNNLWIQTGVSVRKRSIWVKINKFFVRYVLEMWRMTLENTEAHPLCYFKLCASFHNHWCIKTGVRVRKRPVWFKISGFLPAWPLNLMDDNEKQYGTSFMLLQALCSTRCSHRSNSNWGYSPQTPNSGQFGPKSTIFRPVRTWQMTFEKKKAPLLCYLKLCASFHSHPWIETNLETLNSGALLFGKVIHQITRSHGSKNEILPKLGVSGL